MKILDTDFLSLKNRDFREKMDLGNRRVTECEVVRIGVEIPLRDCAIFGQTLTFFFFFFKNKRKWFFFVDRERREKSLRLVSSVCY